MSRCGYSDDLDQQDLAMYRGRVASAMRGKRGQSLLRDCLAALNEMPEKQLIKDELVTQDGVCLLGAAGQKRGIADLDKLDPEDHETLGKRFDVAYCLIQELEYVNDEAFTVWGREETPEERFARVRKWVNEHINRGESV